MEKLRIHSCILIMLLPFVCYSILLCRAIFTAYRKQWIPTDQASVRREASRNRNSHHPYPNPNPQSLPPPNHPTPPRVARHPKVFPRANHFLLRSCDPKTTLSCCVTRTKVVRRGISLSVFAPMYLPRKCAHYYVAVGLVMVQKMVELPEIIRG